MPKRSAGLLMHRLREGAIEVLLVHPGGPFWAKKDLGAWSIPKGEYLEDEEPIEGAKREFQEETGFAIAGALVALGSVKQAGGKIVTAWTLEGDCDPAKLHCSTSCTIEWPPSSGRSLEFPEIDRCAWFSIGEARERILKSQEPFLGRLVEAIDVA